MFYHSGLSLGATATTFTVIDSPPLAADDTARDRLTTTARPDRNDAFTAPTTLLTTLFALHKTNTKPAQREDPADKNKRKNPNKNNNNNSSCSNKSPCGRRGCSNGGYAGGGRNRARHDSHSQNRWRRKQCTRRIARDRQREKGLWGGGG